MKFEMKGEKKTESEERKGNKREKKRKMKRTKGGSGQCEEEKGKSWLKSVCEVKDE